MAAQTVCSFYKFGYCKHKEYCRKRHVKETCENLACDISTCDYRHPKVCKWYRDYHKCKFDPCLFLHKANDTKIDMLKKENEAISKNIQNIENALKDLDAKMVDSETIIDRLENIQNKFERFTEMEKQICDQETLISTLVKRVNDMEEVILNQKDDTTKDQVEKSNVTKSSNAENEIVAEEIIEEASFECDKCGFISKNNHGLKIHKKKKHGEKLKCDLCDKEFDSKRFLEIHTKAHSYNKQKQKYVCDKCECECTTLETLEVHSGKCCNDYIECGLCELRFDSLEVLEIHLTTCEIYECADRLEKYKCLSDMKSHIKEEHENGNGFNHMKMDREDSTKVNFKAYSFSEV